MGSDRASCRMRIAFGENHRESGVTLKVRVIWVPSKTAFATSALRLWIILVNAFIFVASGLCMELSTGGNHWYPKDSRRLLALQSELHPNRAALQPCLDGAELTAIWRVHRRLNAPRPLSKGVMRRAFVSDIYVGLKPGRRRGRCVPTLGLSLLPPFVD